MGLVDMNDKWNRIIAIMVCVGCILGIVTVVVLVSVYMPAHQQEGFHFDPQVTKKYLYYAFAAYNTPAIGTWSCPYCVDITLGFTITGICQANDLWAMVGYNKRTNDVVISFRGEANVESWVFRVLRNYTAPTYDFPGVTGGKVQIDFWNQYTSLKSCVIDEARNIISQTQQAGYLNNVVGHGLGGALAELTALDMIANLNFPNVRLFTYGAPRVGNQVFAEAIHRLLAHNSVRMVESGDCVARLPGLEIGYWHPPYEVFEAPVASAIYRECDGTGEDPTCNNAADFNCAAHTLYMGIECCSRP